MTSVHFHLDHIYALKRASRRRLPAVKNSHLYEAIASALRFRSWAALRQVAKEWAKPLQSPPTNANYHPIVIEAFNARLIELGYVGLDLPEGAVS